MRGLLAIALLLTLGADYPRHRRFLQPNLPAGGAAACTNFPATTNNVLQSQDFLTTWGKLNGGGAGALTVTAAAHAAPSCAQVNNTAGCGTTSATRLQFVAMAAGAYQALRQTGLSGTASGGLWVLGNGQSGTLHISINNLGACAACAYNATTWVRCSQLNVTASAFWILSDPTDCGTPSELAKDVFIWQADVQPTATLSVSVKTTTAPVTQPAGCY